ncbi:TonB-dependent hemoglobin/transferrin/lactoferrin family receptor [Dokdonella sp.]|uniref:TonB-dependent hemoglobin/transferrin/lactoferrin family receptor n=1 Tax=Dokdonella sp. TaxID=2291710 RepID=UPI001B162E33|nr:TonB-dependent hemoglobin/transferrin/lactoferrin family receptor [Dokdonella sp.]MBO9661674.1 TonB-dependent hemoglobin/transferrin/lactoferrin family receptor [Dokdonella sp.]
MIRTPLAGAVLAALAGVAHAETPEPELGILDELDRIVVTATMTPRAQKDVASEVSVIDALEIDRRQMHDIADLVRYEPGVSVTGSSSGGNRFGTGGFAIRGLSGNRVRIEVDGIAVPDAFAIGSFSSAGRDVVDVDALKRVEIVRGAASSLYGSDALAGVVAFTTKDPADYLGKDGGQFASAKLLYDSASRETALSGTWAGGSARDGVVLVATHRDGHAQNTKGEDDSAGARRTRPNPQDTRSDALLAKYVHAADSGRIDRLTFDGERGKVDTDVLSSRGYSAMTNTLTTRLDGRDESERLRLSFGQELPLVSAFADRLDWKIYAQRSEVTQDTHEDRWSQSDAGLVNPKQRFRRFTFEQRVLGAEATARKDFRTGGVEHAITYGVDLARTRTQEQRDGWQRDVTTGAVTNVVSPDTFPVRDFPTSDTTTAALFAQDEMRLADGRLSLIPALRVDYYKMEPRHDGVFAEDNPGVRPVALDHTSWSPKLGAIWRFDDTWSAFAQYAHGFRAPPYNDVNIGFTNLQFGYTALPNPKLKPETSNGLELGLRANGRYGYASVSAYENRYRDFIESQSFVGTDPETGLMLFQSVNRSRVKIRGAEIRYGLDFGAFADTLAGFSLKGNLAYAHADDETAKEPLASVDPLSAVVGLAYERDDWSTELLGRFVERKDRLPKPAEGEAAPFAAPGYATVDFYARWKPYERLEVFGALTNLTDRRYWNWGMVNAIPYSAATINRYSEPGRAVRVGLRATF